VVSVPESEDIETIPKPADEPVSAATVTQHTEIQYHLLKLGSEMGLNVWVAKNDRSKVWNGETLGSLKGIVAELPTQFNEVTNRTVELIDINLSKPRSGGSRIAVESAPVGQLRSSKQKGNGIGRDSGAPRAEQIEIAKKVPQVILFRGSR
jgi:hypothetical protein